MTDWELTPEGFHEVMKNFAASYERLLKWSIRIAQLSDGEQDRITAIADDDKDLDKTINLIAAMKKQLNEILES